MRGARVRLVLATWSLAVGALMVGVLGPATPAAAGPAPTVSQVSAGGDHTCALSTDNRIFCWGDNAQGALGDGSNSEEYTPVQVPTSGTPLAGKTIASVTAGGDSSCAVTTDGVGACWGDNSYAQLGGGTFASYSLVPVAVRTTGTPLAGKSIGQINMGDRSACAVTTDGVAVCWGNGSFLGNGSPVGSVTAVAVTTSGTPLAGKSVAQISVGDTHTCARTTDGIGACWGTNSFGELGNGSTNNSMLPTGISGGALSGHTILQISAGRSHTCAVADTHTVACWGYGSNGALGDNSQIQVNPSPIAVTTSGTALAGATVTHVEAADNRSCALTSVGAVACWGDGAHGGLGDNSATDFLTPVAVTTSGTSLAGKTVTQLSDTASHTCVLTTEGLLSCWGDNTHGENGDGTAGHTLVPSGPAAGVLTGQTAAEVAVGSSFSCARTTTSLLACWGTGQEGELGNSSLTGSTTPVAVHTSGTVLAGKTIQQVVADAQQACALTSDSIVACWGVGSIDGISSTPVAVATTSGPLAGKTIAQITAGLDHACALATDSTLACWGYDTQGQLGDGTTGRSTTPVPVVVAGTPLAGLTITQVAAGGNETCALASNSSIACWGDDTAGALGDGGSTNSSVPVAVATGSNALTGQTVSRIAVGYGNACALTATNGPVCWGANNVSQLGNGGTGATTSPVAVTTSGTPLSGATISHLTAGAQAACGVTTTSGVACWGLNKLGFLGAGTNVDYLSVPSALHVGGTPLAGKTVATVALGSQHGCAVTSDGVVDCWGANTDGQLGIGILAYAPVPAAVAWNLPVLPGAPTIGTAVPGDTQATVTWTAPASNGGATINAYVVTPYIGGLAQTPVTFAGSGTTHVLTGLTDGTTYTFTVAAQNIVGTGPQSAASNAVTPGMLPGAPTIGTATAADSQATVNWTAPASDGGSPITSYLVTPYNGEVAQAPVTSAGNGVSKVVTGLANGNTYTFTVAAVNAVGTGPQSAASNTVTPTGPITVPAAPIITAATAGNAQVSLSWTLPASGGSPITGYVITPYIGATAQTPIAPAGTTTSYVVTGLTNNVAYTFTVAAVNAIGTGPASAASQPATPVPPGTNTPPGPPTIGTATAGNGQVSLTWTAPTSDGGSPVTSYAITPYIGSTPQSQVNTFGAGTSRTISGLTNGTTYTFKVAAVNNLGAGQQSAASNPATPAPSATVPDPPTIGATVPGDGQVSVSWTAPGSDGGSPITSYSVTSYINSVAQTVYPSPGTGTNAVITGLTNGTTYTFKVAAVNSVGTGALSASTGGVTPASVPGTPIIGTATGGPAQATVTWTAPASDGGSAITSYLVTPYIGAAAQSPVVSPGTGTARVVDGLTNGTTYTFTVIAVNAVGTSAESAPSNAVTPLSAPAAPTIGVATAGISKATVTWSAPGDVGGTPLTGYVVTPFIGGTAQTPVPFNSTATTETITGLTIGTTYTFTVAAVNAVGTGADSAASNAVTPVAYTVPDAPTIGNALPGNAQATMSWTAPAFNGNSSITGYVVTPYVSGVAGTPVNFAGAGTSNKVVTGLTNGTTYTFRVAAKNAAGTGAQSGDSVAVTAGAPSNVGFQAAAPGNASAKVAWTPPNNNGSPVTGYVITPFIGTTAQAAQTFNTTATSDVATGLTNGTTYTFSIQAINANGTGSAVSTAPIIVGTPTGPGFPGVQPGSTTARLNWLVSAPNAAPIQGYIVTPYIGSVAQSPTTFNSTANAETVTGLTSGTTYTFKVAGFNSFGTGPASQTPAIIEGSPTQPGFQSAAPGNATARVQFTTPPANSAPISSYTVWPVQGSTVLAAQVFNTPSATALTVTGLTNGVTYTFRVAATNSVGTGPYSVTNAVTVGAPTSPAFPLSQSGDTTAKVAWLASADNGTAITGYVVTPYVGSTAKAPQSFPGTATSVTVTGLTNGTTYSFHVAAQNAFGNSPDAPTALTIIEGTPTSPVFPSAAPLNASAKVAWAAPTAPASAPITGYVITPYVGTTAKPAQTFASTATNEVVTGLLNGTTYTFRVAALNSYGTGSYSTTGSVKVGLPSAPTGAHATAGTHQATVTWVAPAANGSAITAYIVTPYIGSAAQTPVTFNSTATSEIVTGLTTGTTYTFKVSAVNSFGTGAQSSASNAATPT